MTDQSSPEQQEAQKTISVRVSPTVHHKLRWLSFVRNTTMSALGTEALEALVKDVELPLKNR